MDQYSAIFDQAIQQESDFLPDDELFADVSGGEADISGAASDPRSEQVDTLGAFRGIIVGVPVALVLWAPILAAGYYLMG